MSMPIFQFPLPFQSQCCADDTIFKEKNISKLDFYLLNKRLLLTHLNLPIQWTLQQFINMTQPTNQSSSCCVSFNANAARGDGFDIDVSTFWTEEKAAMRRIDVSALTETSIESLCVEDPFMYFSFLIPRAIMQGRC